MFVMRKNVQMYAITEEIVEEGKVPLSICPRCGRQVRIDGHCDCEALPYSAAPPRQKE